MRTAALTAVASASLAFAACGGTTATSASATSADYADAMHGQHAGETPEATPTATTRATDPVPVTSADVAYHTDASVEVVGHASTPSSPGAGVGVVLVHEWWGLNDNIREVSVRLASHGFATLAIDTYGGEVAGDADGARALMMAALDDPMALMANVTAAADWLRDEAGVERVVVMGYCYGGGVALHAAIDAAPAIDGAVIYYGRVTDDVDRLAQIDDPILGFFGGLDQGIPVDGVRAFEAALHDVGADATIHVFDDADHAFANPSGQRYQPEAAERAWTLTVDFLSGFDEPTAAP